MRIIIDGKEFEVNLTKDGSAYIAEVDGKRMDVVPGNPSAVIGGRRFSTHIESEDSRHFGVQVDNEFFDAMLVSDISYVQDNVTAPLRGVITEVLVKTGARVKKGQVFLKLLSMKMETELTASRSCVVKKVHAKKDQVVDKGDLLVETG
jgi:biotin carboxyl carrier protein